jgi:hypothetical protein
MRHLAALLLLAHAVLAGDVPALRLVHLDDGIRGDLEKSPIFKHARSAGVDLRRWREPLLVHCYRNGRLFYLFYKTTENALADRPYLIQRIRKTERAWPMPGAKPEVRVTYQVEVFKTFAGALKRADQHYGSFGLRDYARREIVKEYEIGFGGGRPTRSASGRRAAGPSGWSSTETGTTASLRRSSASTRPRSCPRRRARHPIRIRPESCFEPARAPGPSPSEPGRRPISLGSSADPSRSPERDAITRTTRSGAG